MKFLIPIPIASFEIIGIPCLDSTIFIDYTGTAPSASFWNWEFSGAEFTATTDPHDFYLKWDEPGIHEVRHWIEYFGCTSDTFSMSITLEASLTPPLITCIEEDYYSLTFEWEPVEGADEYFVSNTLGNGKLSGTSYTVTNLPDNTPVSVTVTVIGSVCGPSSSTIECQTLEFIPVNIFIPDIFSPNDDGINDVFHVHANSQITEVSILRIFDRWGNIIFEKLNCAPNEPNKGWDGTFSGKEMNAGVYLYWIELETSRGREIVTGDLTLIR